MERERGTWWCGVVKGIEDELGCGGVALQSCLRDI